MSAGKPRRTALVSGLIALALLGSVPSASAAPADDIAATRENATQARDKLDDLAADLELRNEEYLEVSDKLSRTRADIAATERELEAATADQDAAALQLQRRAASMYRNGPFGFLEVIIGSTDYQDLVTRLDLMRFIGRSDANALAQVTASRERIDLARRTLETRHIELVTLRESAAAMRAEVERALQSQESYLARINNHLRDLIAAEKRRKEAAAARRAAQIAARLIGTSGTGRTFDAAALGPPHPQAVTIARRFVDRTPYRWGGVTPAGFDCSGLVQYCYSQMGISIPRTSKQQYLGAGAFIPPDKLDLLEPGDLVFFGYDGNPNKVHHVGMYVGDGNMIHAPQAGQLVSVSSLLERIERRGDYVGACRP